jgi:hypothetical protein
VRTNPTLEAPLPAQAVSACRALTALATTVVLAALAAGCGDRTNELPPPAAPAPHPASQPAQGLDLSPAEQQAVAEARATFDEFMTAYIEVSTADLPTADTAEDLFFRVERHADGLLPQELRSEIIGRWGAGQIVDGDLEWTFEAVVDVDLERVVDGNRIPRVRLRYCVDATDWLVVDSGTSAPAGRPGGRHLWDYAVSWFDDWGGQGLEGWRVVEGAAGHDRPC